MALTPADKLDITEQIHRHQRYIDNDASPASARKYADLYWPDATFHTLYTNPVGLYQGTDSIRQLYDYAHSAFPIDQQKHLVSTMVLEGDGNEATVEWYWIVMWRKAFTGLVSSGTYVDRFQKRDGVWKCLERKHAVDDNWPRPYFDDLMARAAAR